MGKQKEDLKECEDLEEKKLLEEKKNELMDKRNDEKTEKVDRAWEDFVNERAKNHIIGNLLAEDLDIEKRLASCRSRTCGRGVTQLKTQDKMTQC